MSGTDLKVGYFVLSLDTELAWGGLNWEPRRVERTLCDAGMERQTIQRLLGMMDEFGIRATWAITGHLFYEACEECPVCLVEGLRGKDSRFEKIWRSRGPLWYGADICNMLLSRGSRHEIAFHGYTHRVFSEAKMSEAEAVTEIHEWFRVARRKNVVARSVVFPRNQVGHLNAFKENGFFCYRGIELVPKVYALPILGKVLNRLDLVLQLRIPEVYEPKAELPGLVNLPASRWLFRIDPKVDKLLESLHLAGLPIRRIVQGVEKAAKEKKVIHIWAHPFEFRTEKDWQKLRCLFGSVSELASQGKLQAITMADLAAKVLEQED
jgi:peptidoglycan/xylan/chitin deacetylase (PgdA/CDA1 family)